jgi:hypothetical protein
MIMEELLEHLEKQIKELTGQHHQLKENSAREKELLLIKQKKAINQIETLISSLKSIEKTT